jgi:HEAT repeat protein
MTQCRHRPDQQEEREKPAVPHHVLDIVPEDPEVEHVPGEVHQTPVQEHRADDRKPWGDGRIADDRAKVEQFCRNRGIGEDKLLSVRAEDFVHEHQTVQNDQRDRHEGGEGRRILISEGNHFSSGRGEIASYILLFSSNPCNDRRTTCKLETFLIRCKTMRVPSKWFLAACLAGSVCNIGIPDPVRGAADPLQEARTAFERREYDSALRILDDLLKTNPMTPQAYELRAVVQAYLGRPELALADYDRLSASGKSQERDHLLRRVALGLLVQLMSQEQELVRAAAVTALAECGPAGAQTPLETALKDASPRVRSLAIQTAGRLGLAATLPSIRKAVDDPDPSVRLSALSVVGQSKAAAFIPAIRRRIRDQEQLVQLVARETLIRLGQPESLQPFFAAARDFSPEVRGTTMGILGRLKDPSALPILTLGMHDPDATVRSFAAGALGDLGVPAAVPELLEALKDQDPYVRNFAAASLGRLNAKAAIPVLWEVLKDSDSLVRLAAAESLVRLGEEEAALAFRELAKDPNYGVRSAAISAMARTTPSRGMAFALEFLDDPAPRVRVAAIQALGKTRGKAMIPYLRRALLDKDPTVRAFAAGQLGGVLREKA